RAGSPFLALGSRGGPDDRLGDGPRAVPLETGSGHAPGQLTGHYLRVAEVYPLQRAGQLACPRCQLIAGLLWLGYAVHGEDRLENGPRVGSPLPLGQNRGPSFLSGGPASLLR